MYIPYENWRFPTDKNHTSHLLPLLSIQCMSRHDLSVKGGTSERCYRTRRGRTDEQRYAIISTYFDGRIKMNGPYPEITNVSFLAKLFFKTFMSLKHLSDYQTVGLSDRQTIGLSDYRIIGLSDYSYGPVFKRCYSTEFLAFAFNIGPALVPIFSIAYYVFHILFMCLSCLSLCFLL